MIDLEQKIKIAIGNAFINLFDYTLQSSNIILQPTRKEFEGNYTFVVFPYIKQTKKKPEELGNIIGKWMIENTTSVVKFNVVNGFLNFVINHQEWIDILSRITKEENYGDMPAKNKKVMIEFSSPNTNKPLHLGHLRNNFLGDSTARILQTNGYEVMKTNLVNDRGIHICKSMLAYQKLGNNENPQHASIKGDHFIGKYYVKFNQLYKTQIEELVSKGMTIETAKKEAECMKESQNLLKLWEKGHLETVTLWKKMNGWVYEGFDKTYKTIGIVFDKIYKESETYLLGKYIVNEGLKKNVFYKKEDQSVWVDLSKEGMDEKLILRSDGTSVYITQDMGTCDMKYKDYKFDKTVFVVGNEQDYHFKVLFAIMEKMGRKYAKGLYHLSYGMVDLPSGKMKSREGTVVDADELVQKMLDTAKKHTDELGKTDDLSPEESKKLYHQIGIGALKYYLLKVDPKKRILFDPKESIQFHGNTGPFIQYTYARISAILRRAKSIGISPQFSPSSIQELHKKEIEIIYRLTMFIPILKETAKELSSAILAQYLYDLAKDYNGFYQEIFIFDTKKDTLKTSFKVALSKSVAQVLKKGMNLLGIDVPERM